VNLQPQQQAPHRCPPRRAAHRKHHPPEEDEVVAEAVDVAAEAVDVAAEEGKATGAALQGPQGSFSKETLTA